MFRIICFCLLIIVAGGSLRKKTILILRHAEKPKDGNDYRLSPTGNYRASQLPHFFANHFPLVRDHIFATANTRVSHRPVLTMTPTAHMYNLRIDQSITDKKYRDLARRLTHHYYDHQGIIICWHHKQIPALALSLGASKDELPYHEWPDSVFDEVWVLEFEHGKVNITTIKQNIF